MADLSGYWQKFAHHRATRRRILAAMTATGAGLAALAVGCSDDEDKGTTGTTRSDEGEPRPGDELPFAVAEPPPSFDGHRETTFAMLHPLAPHYSTLLRFDQNEFPRVVGDLAESWTQPDNLTVTMKIRSGVRFHDASPLTTQDIKVSYERIINPPTGVASARRASYEIIDRVDAPDASTITFKLKHPSASIIPNLASPWNFIYKAASLTDDARWPEKNVLGTGPFKMVEYVPGSHWIAQKNPDYFISGRPYLDGFRALFIRDTAARVAAVRSGQALIEFRSFSPEDRDQLVRALGDKVTVQESPWTCNLTVVLNTEKKPFDDVRVRRALSMSLDRWAGSTFLSRISLMGPVGGLLRPGYELATPERDLVKLAGFAKDSKPAIQEARNLLRAAGAENLSIEVKNRNVKEPYEAAAVFVIDQWRQIGVNGTHVPLEGGTYFNDLRAGAYDAGIDFACDFLDEPDVQLLKFTSAGAKNPINYGRYTDATLDDLYEKQSRTTNAQDRIGFLRQFEKRVLDEQAYQFHILWWQRIIPHSNRVRGWKITPNHYVNQDLRDVWLAPSSASRQPAHAPAASFTAATGVSDGSPFLCVEPDA